MLYLIHTPWWLKKIWKGRVWSIDTDERILYLSFDDGPHPVITPKVLNLLRIYKAKASFFCVGENVMKYPEVYASILHQGHCVGNHTMQHLNAAKVKDDIFLQDVLQAKQWIDSKIFRPPYGRLSGFLQQQIEQEMYDLKTVMWSVLSGDFDPDITAEKCRDNVLLHAREGSIIVFHDSEKAADKMLFALEACLKYFTDQGYRFEAITNELLSQQLEKN